MINTLEQKRKYSSILNRNKSKIVANQKKLAKLERSSHLSIQGIKDINRQLNMGRIRADRAKKEMVEGKPQISYLDCKKIYKQRASIPRLNSRR